MLFRRSVWLSGAAVIVGAALMLARPAGGEDNAASAPRRQARVRLTKPWNELKDLTADEKTRILEIHQKAIDQIHEIEAKEHQDILAMLTDEQKKEVAAIEAKDKESRRSQRAKTEGGTSAGANSGGTSGSDTSAK